MEDRLPDGWKRIEDPSGPVYYLTRHPQVKITKRCQLEKYHGRGRYQEMNLVNLDFGTKRRAKKFSYEEFASDIEDEFSVKRPKLPDNVATSGAPSLHCDETESTIGSKLDSNNSVGDNPEWNWRKKPDLQDLDSDNEDKNKDDFMKSGRMETEKKEARLDCERAKLEKAVNKLTLDRKDTIDHHEALTDAADSLNKVRNSFANLDLNSTAMNNLKSRISASQNSEEMVHCVRSNPELKQMISNIEHSMILEQLLKISALPENPLNDFPLNINRNHYSDIVNFGIKQAPDAIAFILKIATKNEAPIAEMDVVRCAYMFSSLASSVSRLNNALKKTKSAMTKNNGTTNVGVDELAIVGITETSRSCRNDRDFLASLNDHILKSHAQTAVPQITFDNMDLTVGGVMHHMTLPFLEFEPENTSHLSMEEKPFEVALEYFKEDTVLITSAFNSILFEHYLYVTAWTLAQLLGSELERFSWLKQVFPKHYKHPNSSTSSRKSLIFVQKPLNYSENSNNEMIKIMESLQWTYLNLVGQQSKDKEAFFTDLKTIYTVESDKDIREEAEIRIKEEVKSAGELIAHGDLLTDVRFEACKRLRRMGDTSVERFDFLKIFRLRTFHLAMNKYMQDIVAGMKSEVNVEDTISLGYIKTTMGLNQITNNPDVIKKDGNYEKHRQFCDEVGSELLIEAFKTYVDKTEEVVEKTEKSAQKLILDFLKTMDIKFHYDPDNYDERKKHDDMMTSARDNAGRTVISLVLSSVEHEGDGLGLRALRTVMIPYFLNKKIEVQDSKYAARLLANRILFLQASDRTQARIDLLACCNPSGKPGHSIARDMENEHKVKSTKNILRGMHSQLGDLAVEKSVLGSNILEMIDSHDRQSMLLLEEGGKSSYRYLNEAQRMKIRKEISTVKPFEYNREKVDYNDKPRSAFCGLTAEKIQRFLVRNRGNFSRNSPHKDILVKKKIATREVLETDELSLDVSESCSLRMEIGEVWDQYGSQCSSGDFGQPGDKVGGGALLVQTDRDYVHFGDAQQFREQYLSQTGGGEQAGCDVLRGQACVGAELEGIAGGREYKVQAGDGEPWGQDSCSEIGVLSCGGEKLAFRADGGENDGQSFELVGRMESGGLAGGGESGWQAGVGELEEQSGCAERRVHTSGVGDFAVQAGGGGIGGQVGGEQVGGCKLVGQDVGEEFEGQAGSGDGYTGEYYCD